MLAFVVRQFQERTADALAWLGSPLVNGLG
jgi:hypothetical protein